MSCITYLHNDPLDSGTKFISGTTCTGSASSYNLNFGESACMEADLPLVICDGLTISGSCSIPTPSPTPTPSTCSSPMVWAIFDANSDRFDLSAWMTAQGSTWKGFNSVPAAPSTNAAIFQSQMNAYISYSGWGVSTYSLVSAIMTYNQDPILIVNNVNTFTDDSTWVSILVPSCAVCPGGEYGLIGDSDFPNYTTNDTYRSIEFYYSGNTIPQGYYRFYTTYIFPQMRSSISSPEYSLGSLICPTPTPTPTNTTTPTQTPTQTETPAATTPSPTPTTTETPTPTQTGTEAIPPTTPTQTPTPSPTEAIQIFTHSAVLETCSDYCNANYNITTSTSATASFAALTIGDTIFGQGGVAGFVAYSNISTDTTTGPFRIAEINSSGVILGIYICNAGSCEPL